MNDIDVFKKCNMKEKDYANAKFNQTVSESRDNLNFDLQQNLGKRQSLPYLLFKNVPKGMTKLILRNICSKHGLVKEVRYDNKSKFYFVDFATVADAETTCRSLRNNIFGFQVVVGKKKAEVEIPSDSSTQSSCINSEKLRQGIYSKTDTMERQDLKNENNEINANLEENTGRATNYTKNKNQPFSTISNKTCSNSECSQKSASFKINKCTLCKQDCDLCCRRCRALYCNIQCQTKDWEKHRRICGRSKPLQMKKIIAANDSNQEDAIDVSYASLNGNVKRHENNDSVIIQKVPRNGIRHASLNGNYEQEKYEKYDHPEIIEKMPRSGNIVTITSIAKTNVLFIRSIAYDDNENFLKTVNGLQKLGKSLKTVIMKPKRGQILISKFRKQICRVMILNYIGTEEVAVVYSDYGDVAKVKLKDLYEAPNEYTYIPRYAIPVTLKGVSDHYMTEEIRNFMNSYLNVNVYVKYKAEDLISDKAVYMVELLDESSQESINKIINKLATPREPLNSSEICFKDYLRHVLLPSSSNIELVVMDNSLMRIGIISCALEPFAFEIQKFKKDIQKYAQNSSFVYYTPQINELCIAKYSICDEWYRGCCLELDDGHASVMFIDYGNTARVVFDNIRPYPLQFTYPIYTCECEIRGLPEKCNEKLLEKLEELITKGSVLKCEEVQCYEADKFHSLSLPHVLKELNSSGLLEAEYET
uniref:Tudor domain-containing protein 1 n=1 Tax=Glossina brevipalpis TaxID=37001 RepID=A0A1A9WR44_9MUSC